MLFRRASRAVPLALLTACCSAAAQAGAQGDARATFRVGVDTVFVQVSVSDASNRFVDNLAKENFRVFEDSVEQTLTVTRGGRALIDQAAHVRLLVEPDLSVLVFERIGWGEAEYNAWSAELLDEGFAFVTATKHAGQVCTRFAIVNPKTTVDDLAQILDSMK